MAKWTWRQVAKKVVGVLLLLIAFLIMFRWFEHRQVYIPYATLQATGSELGRPFEDVYFETDDKVRLNGWFYPAEPDSKRKDLAVLLLHGNAGNISHRLHIYEALLETGVNLFSFDYRGYGRSKGRPGEEGTYRDAEAAHRWLRNKGFAPTNIIALGKSLGGGVASELALRAPLGGLVLQNTFSSIPDLGAELFPWLPVRSLASIRYDTRSKLPLLSLPVLVMHSPADEIIGFHHGKTNFAAANDPKMFQELRGGHNETLQAGRSQFLQGLERFLNRHFPPKPEQPPPEK